MKAQLCNGDERIIAGLPLTNANYTRIIELLQERFAQPYKNIHAHMEALLNMPSPADLQEQPQVKKVTLWSNSQIVFQWHGLTAPKHCNHSSAIASRNQRH